MPRPQRFCPAGMVFHCLNRAVARLTLFEKDADYAAFERVLEEAQQRVPLRILDYVVMPNHWHLVVWPQTNTEVTEFLQWLTTTHTMRWHAHYETSGTGHLYQGRFKSFPVQGDEHLLTLLRYVERNPRRAGLARRAEEWRWGSAWRRRYGDARSLALLTDGPVARPRNWLELVNRPQTEAEVEALRRCIQRGMPYGSELWTKRAAGRLDLQSTLRPRGRPRKKEA
ncbi:MAG: transposase [Pirellulales bacterium]